MDTSTPQSNPCKVPGHEEQQLIPYMCTSQRCDQISRFLCQECLVDFLHSHNGSKPQLLSKEKLSAQFKSNIAELKQKHQQKLQASAQQNKETLSIISKIEVQIQNLKYLIEQQNEQSSDSDENYFDSLNNLITQSFFELSPDNINNILNISDFKLNSLLAEDLKQIFQDLTLSFETFKDKITKYHIYNSLDYTSVNIDDKIKQFKYADQYLSSYSNKRDYSHIKISPDNFYIAIAYKEYIELIDYQWIKKNNQFDYCFEVLDFNGLTLEKITLAKNQIDFLQFSNDSQILYYYENSEPFSSYNIPERKIKQYKYFLELKKIKLILPVQWNRAFVLNQFNQIQLLDMEFENKLFEIQALHPNDIIYDKIHKILISSTNNSISLFDGETGIMIYESSLKLNLKQLQLSEDGTKLFGNDKEYFYKLNIVLNQKLFEINVVEKFKHQEAIISYRLVWNLQYIIIFGENGIISIYDQNFKMIKQFHIGLHGEQRMQLTSGSCSNDFSAITVGSTIRNKYQRLALEKKN